MGKVLEVGPSILTVEEEPEYHCIDQSPCFPENSFLGSKVEEYGILDHVEGRGYIIEAGIYFVAFSDEFRDYPLVCKGGIVPGHSFWWAV